MMCHAASFLRATQFYWILVSHWKIDFINSALQPGAAYMSYSEQRTEEVADKRIEGMWKAFTTLVEATGNKEQEVSQEYFFLFLEDEHIRSSTIGVMRRQKSKARIMWDAIDRVFIGVVGLIQYDFWKFRAFVDSGEDLELHVITLERILAETLPERPLPLEETVAT
ncbi:hypothetical protein AK812_SmicGene22803 [Symbiodinium microadriaticum]|uniref:Uncharacterized protein n=1 Tax=Symbiodinium microadriaticum TaxID=2951 RepID=A0A1Q9DIY2_SYMMI|nr:hypothetical protein AK812_SmicGene22803 [Symbiodinium microadriaticum]